MAIKSADICCGLAWGDEAKGKIVSHLIQKNDYDWICRWNGGSNAGHTIYIGGKKYATHIIPAGVFYNIPCYIGPDCLINVDAFIKEINYLNDNGFDTSKIFVSGNAHVITKEHVNDDISQYQKQQGSTGTGIAPCARDKFARKGILLKDYDNFPYKDNVWKESHSPLFGNILCEGAQGFWLDIIHGMYPYVTSSYTLPYSACSLGFTHRVIRNVYGAAKVYDTRVGVDPYFEHHNAHLYKDTFDNIAKIGEEYGTTTKRMRKVEWLNLDKMIYAINTSGTNIIIMSKIDILEKINKFAYIYNNDYVVYDNKDDFIKNINTIILNKCSIVDKIIYSDNPETINHL